MRLKKLGSGKTSRISFRCTNDQENEMQRKANIYTDGNLSEYLIYVALNFVPSKEDFETTKQRSKNEQKRSKRKG